MALEHLIVIGASAGGLEVLEQVVAALPPELPAAICVVVHVSPESPGAIPRLLSRSGALPAEIAAHGCRLQPGHIYVAPADHHLIIEPERLRVSRGPRENRFRPAIDPLFRSAAQVYGPRVIGVVLSGNLDDGAAGLWAIKQLGGIAVVQDPADALFPSMPEHAAALVRVDYRASALELGPLLVSLTSMSVQDRPIPSSDPLKVEVDIASGHNAREAGIESLGQPSQFACPECHGTLREIIEGGHRRFRCYTGHAYSVAALSASISEAIDMALWTTVRALDEAGRLLLHLVEQHGALDSDQLQADAKQAFKDAEALRRIAERRGEQGMGEGNR